MYYCTSVRNVCRYQNSLSVFGNLLSESVLKRCISALLSILDGPDKLAVEKLGIPGVAALGPRISLRTSSAF